MSALTARLRGLLRKKFIRDTLILQAGKIGNTLLSVVSLVIVIRLMGPDNYGVWRLVLALFGISQAFDVTGIGMATATRLALAIGKGDEPEILNLLAVYVKVGLAWALLTALALFTIGPWVAHRLYGPDTPVAGLVGVFSLSLIADTLYTMVIVALQSRRSMKTWAILQYANQIVLTASVVVAVVASATPQGMVAGRLFYSYSTMVLAFVVYVRTRTSGPLTFPPLASIFRRAIRISPRGYWRFGFLLALDKNVGQLYTQIPIALVGVLSGSTEAGFLGVAIDSVGRLTILTGAILDNLQAVVPQAVGRADFIGLRRNFLRAFAVMAAVGVGFYGLVALFAPWAVPLLLGHESAPAAPVVVALCLYGAVTTAGGIFGPLYRALDVVRPALWVKIIAALIMLPPGLLLIAQRGAVGGAWFVDGLYVLSVAATALVTLPALNARARAQASGAVSTGI